MGKLWMCEIDTTKVTNKDVVTSENEYLREDTRTHTRTNTNRTRRSHVNYKAISNAATAATTAATTATTHDSHTDTDASLFSFLILGPARVSRCLGGNAVAAVVASTPVITGRREPCVCGGGGGRTRRTQKTRVDLLAWILAIKVASRAPLGEDDADRSVDIFYGCFYSCCCSFISQTVLLFWVSSVFF